MLYHSTLLLLFTPAHTHQLTQFDAMVTIDVVTHGVLSLLVSVAEHRSVIGYLHLIEAVQRLIEDLYTCLRIDQIKVYKIL